MKKFELLEGGDSTTVELDHIRKIDIEYKQLEHKLAYSGLLVYAYHYSKLGCVRKAEEIFKKIPRSYYGAQIYKDLSFALLCWSLHKGAGERQMELYAEASFYLVLKQGLPYFKKLSFENKPFLMQFYREFYEKLKYVYGEE